MNTSERVRRYMNVMAILTQQSAELRQLAKVHDQSKFGIEEGVPPF